MADHLDRRRDVVELLACLRADPLQRTAMLGTHLVRLVEVVDHLHAGQVVGQARPAVTPPRVALDRHRGGFRLGHLGILGLGKELQLLGRRAFARGAEVTMSQSVQQRFELPDTGVFRTEQGLQPRVFFS